MDVMLAINTKNNTIRPASCKILFPAPVKFGICGIPAPPKSNFPVVGISLSVSRPFHSNIVPRHHHSLLRKPNLSYFRIYLNVFPAMLASLHQSLVTSHQSRITSYQSPEMPTQPYH